MQHRLPRPPSRASDADAVGWPRAVDLRLIVVLLTAALAALTVHRVFFALPWGDELRTWRDGVEKPIVEILAWRHEDEHAPLGFLMARAGAVVFGARHVWSMRLGAWACGLACIPALYWLGQRVHSRAAGVLMGLMFAVDPTDVFQMTQARMYTALLLASILAIGFATRLLDRPTAGVGTALAMGTTLGAAIWSHAQIYAAVAAFGVVATACLAAGVRRVGTERRAALASATLLTLGVSIGLAIGAQGVWKMIVTRDRATIAEPKAAFDLPLAQLEDASRRLTGHNLTTAAIVVCAGTGAGFLIARRRTAVAAMLSLIVAFAAFNLLVEARYRSVVFARYLIIAQPSLWTCVAIAIVELVRRWRVDLGARATAIVVSAGFVGLCGVQLWRMVALLPAHPLAAPFRDAVDYVLAQRVPGARFVAMPGSPTAAFARYYGLTADDDAFAALTAGGGRGRRRTTTSPAIADPPQFWMIGVLPTPTRWRSTGQDPLIANVVIARARGIATPADLPDGADRAKSEVVVARYGPGVATQLVHFKRAIQATDEDETVSGE